jgi:transcription-repair coupling factor (superfamily II helicase)
VLILEDKETAAYVLNDLESFIGEDRVLFYPASYKKPYQHSQTDNANILLRAEVLQRFGKEGKPLCIVSYPEAIFEKVIQKKTLEKNTLNPEAGRPNLLRFPQRKSF